MNIQHEKQKLEKLDSILSVIEQADQKIANYKSYIKNWGFFGFEAAKFKRETEITKTAKQRLENYYLKHLVS